MNSDNYEKLSLAIDVVVLTSINYKVHVLLVKRNREPFIGKWGLIGGFTNVCPRNHDGSYVRDQNGKQFNEDETIECAASRIMRRDVGISNQKINLYKLYDDPRRDKRGRVVSACHYVAISNPEDMKIVIGDSITEYKWFPLTIDDLPSKKEFAFDNYLMISEFGHHLKELFRSTPIAFDLIGKQFTIPHLKSLYESVYGRKIDNFSRYLMNRYKMKSLDKKILSAVKSKVGRPSNLYEYLGRIDE